MASDTDDFDKTLGNLKSTAKASFARIYAALKARELKTLRQLEALRKQCQDDKVLNRICVQNIQLTFENESALLDNIHKYGAIDFGKVNFDSSIFSAEDYVSPNDDHMYSYKTIGDLAMEGKELEAIEEAALKEVTKTENCVCVVNIRSEEVSKQFRESEPSISPVKSSCGDTSIENIEYCMETATEDEKSENSDEDVKKIEPTDDWLNSIKNQTETEPSQVNDGMEHSTIVC